MKGFKVIPPRVVRNSVLVTHVPGLGERGEVALMVWRGAFNVCFLVPVFLQRSLKTVDLGHKFLYPNYSWHLSLSRSSLFLASWKRVDPSLWSPLSSPLSNCVALGKSFHSRLECVTISLSEKNKVTAFPRLPRSKLLVLFPRLSILCDSYSTWGRCSGSNVRMTSWEDLRSRGTFFLLTLRKPFDCPSRGGVLCV